VETFARDEKLNFRIPGTPAEGVLQRRAPNVYALNESTEIRAVMSGGRAEWSMVYSSGMFLDAKYRVTR
jgi:hypothetical protein